MYKIELADGATIDNLELNGNNYIPKKLDRDIFADNLSEVTITDNEGNVETLYNQKVQFAKTGNVEAFILSGKTKDEMEREYIIQENEMLSNSITELTMLMSMILEGGM